MTDECKCSGTFHRSSCPAASDGPRFGDVGVCEKCAAKDSDDAHVLSVAGRLLCERCYETYRQR